MACITQGMPLLGTTSTAVWSVFSNVPTPNDLGGGARSSFYNLYYGMLTNLLPQNKMALGNLQATLDTFTPDTFTFTLGDSYKSWVAYSNSESTNIMAWRRQSRRKDATAIRYFNQWSNQNHLPHPASARRVYKQLKNDPVNLDLENVANPAFLDPRNPSQGQFDKGYMVGSIAYGLLNLLLRCLLHL